MPQQIRNIAIIAHVDHGKTSLVDQLLRQSGQFRTGELDGRELIMDSNPLEKERGITILSKNCAIRYTTRDGDVVHINIVDTPGHADFGGEVERVLKMADGVLLVVDCIDGPMPQTRFVLGKALAEGLKPIVVINKMDRPERRPDAVVDEVFDLLVELGANDHALDFPVIFASAREGWAAHDYNHPATDMHELFEAIMKHVPAPNFDVNAPLQMLITTLDYSEYVGRIGVGRVFAGKIKSGQSVMSIDRHGKRKQMRVQQLFQFDGLGKVEVDEILAGDICAVVGLEKVEIGDTLADPANAVALAAVHVDEPTLDMTFRINDGPFVGAEGTFVTSRQVRERLERELQSNVALKVRFDGPADEWHVSGRGMLHLGILLENMRREGFELTVGKPHVIFHKQGGKELEPIERLVVDVPTNAVGPVMMLCGERKAEMLKMEQRGSMTHLSFDIPARGLIGMRNRMLTATGGEAIMHHVFERYDEYRGPIGGRINGVILAIESGQVTGYALENLADRGAFFVAPGDAVYEGQIVGEHCKENDITVNITRGKKLTNMRNANKEATVVLKGARKLSMEAALEYIEDDELVEITPKSIRMRKRMLKEADRKKESRRSASVEV
ncbi:MAG: translational GTPase TypA [Phycisphaerales bacterium]